MTGTIDITCTAPATLEQVQLDAAKLELLKQWRTLAQAHREKRRWAVHYRVTWRAARDVRATAIRAIRAMRKAPRCAGCGDDITPGTMNSEGCALFASGWRCGVCQGAVSKSACTHPPQRSFTEPARRLNSTSHLAERRGCLACDSWLEDERVLPGATE